MIFEISTPKKTVAATFYDVLTGPDFPDFWVIDLTWKVKDLKIGYHRLALVTGNTLVFPRSSSSIKGQTASVCVGGGGATDPLIRLRLSKPPIRARAWV